MATLTSHLNGFINEARVYRSQDLQNTDPYRVAPDGRVTVASSLADGTQSITSLQFGGNPSLPQESRSSLFEGSDEVSWVSRGGGHRVKLGLLANADRSTVGTIPNRYGTFYYNSLADFEANRPSQFTRTMSGRDRIAGSDNAALYLGDAWRVSPRLQFVYGVRAEATRFPNTPDYNPDVETLFNRRTDHTPSETHVSPRLGFTYFMGAPADNPAPAGADTNRAARGGAGGGGGGQRAGFNAAAWTIRGGVGEFRGPISSNLVATAVDATGLAGGQSTLTCIGNSVPTADWTSYLADASTIPTQCAAGNGGVVPPNLTQRRNVTTFEDEFSAPKVWRASLGGSRRGFGRQTTAGDPNAVSRGPSDLERRHSLLGTVTMPAATWLDVTMIARLTAGQRYTPTVNGDINGDGSRNDRAFIFDPSATADTAAGNGISRIPPNAPVPVQDCIPSPLRTIAPRNSCSPPRSPSLSKEGYKSRLSRIIPNPFFATLAQNDSLKLELTADQKSKLKALSDELAPKIDRIAEEMADVLTSAGNAPDPQVIGARMQGKTNEARTIAEKAVADLHAALTPAQWDKLPESIRIPPQGGRGFGGGDGRGGRGP